MKMLLRLLTVCLLTVDVSTITGERKNVKKDKSDTSAPNEKRRPKRIHDAISVAFIDLSGKYNAWDISCTLRQILKNDDIKAILVLAEGSGDSLGIAYTLFSELRYAATKKPVVSLIQDSCTESCYYSIAGTHIVAPPTAMIGIIGSRIAVPRYSNVKLNLPDRTANVNITLIASGKYKTMLDPSAGELTQDEKAYLGQLSQDIYDQFCEDISAARGLPLDKKEEWADGKILVVRQAIVRKINLVDTVGTLSDAFAVIKDLLKKRGEDYEGDIRLIQLDDQKSKDAS